MYIYMKIGKRNGKKEKGKEFPANWAEEEILAQRARVRAWAGGPAGSRRSGTAQAGVVGVGPRASERGGKGVRGWSAAVRTDRR
jgi:hypothetical protein